MMPVAEALKVPLDVPPLAIVSVPPLTFSAPVLLKVESNETLPAVLLYVPALTKTAAAPPSALLNTPVEVSFKTPPVAFVNEPPVPERKLPADQVTVPLFEMER